MKTLHRHVLGLVFTRWAMVLFIGLFLIVLGEFIGEMGRFAEALSHGRGQHLVHYFALRFPVYFAAWLPVSVAVAALLTAWPMLRQGTLVALCAAGIPVRRIFAAMIIMAVLIGVVGFTVQDQVLPRLADEAKLAKSRLQGKLKFNETVSKPVGWHDGNQFWCAQYARPEDGEYHRVAVFSTAKTGERGTLLLADSLLWRDGQWTLKNPVWLVDDVHPAQQAAEISLSALGITLQRDAASLINYLKQDRYRTSDELLHIKAENAWGYIVLRGAFGLLPLLCLLYALPGFLRLDGRHSLGLSLAKSCLWMVIPLVGYWVLSRILVSNSTYVFSGTGIVLGSLLSGGGWRWWTMRL